tara:strand:+ start:1417 stop:2406 length:990 start_codon:yes stop_codon:yes gene_type:complete
MKKIILGVMTLLVISCNEKQPEEFSLRGKTNGIENGTNIYLSFEEELIDSTKVVDNNFKFQTKLQKSPMQVILRTKDYSHYRFLWLENKPMEFNASKTDFRNAKVTGSETEQLSEILRQKIDTIPRSKRHKYRIEFIRSNPEKLFSAYLLSFYTKTWGKEKTIELFNQLSEGNKNSEYGEKISKYIKLNKDPKIGERFVDFEMEDTNGELRRLSDFNGKLVLLEFWASSCGPCRKENPSLVKTYNEYKPKGFEIFAVSEDTKREKWLRAIEKDGLPWLQVSDLSRENTASMIYGINGIPDNFLINQKGIIVGRNLRGEKLNEKLKELLN